MPHIPVMVSEVISYLIWDYSGKYLDCTVGDGMHSHAIMKLISSKCGSVLALDRDKRALKTAEMNLKEFGDNVVLKQSRFSEIETRISKNNNELYSGFLFDLGLNNSRLEESDAGFSYLKNGSLDMRMSQEDMITAGEIINNWPEKKLADLIYFNSDERLSRRIAKAIVIERSKSRIETTTQLKDIIFNVVKGPYRLKSVARCFQALRMTVNDEIEEIKKGLTTAFDYLLPGGRIVVLSYHSIEDRIVKNFFRDHRLTRKSGPGRFLQILTAKPVGPSREETKTNPAARSAKLRAAELAVVD
ncbi:MAG: 16S rRNA (cytosine(1402)-N(4))-methyltransferase RsmH [candidate division Zixibacteria bacterium]|nr:16S rRNA (cytosine(1402)-N(4))-methyltransferase RsmH [candidate division Zixibacteria bacterium]